LICGVLGGQGARRRRDYRFNIQYPEGTVKRSPRAPCAKWSGLEIQPILTGARQNIETAVTELMQKTLDSYNSGIQITRCRCRRSTRRPRSSIFRDVRRPADLERAQNEAQTYANRVVPRPVVRPRRSSSRPKPTGANRRRGEGPDRPLQQDLREYKKAPE
jgi:membrane protease subunit HflK